MKKQLSVLVFRAKTFDTLEEMRNKEEIPFEVKTINDELSIYYEIIGCDYVEITGRRIGDNRYMIICDENGRYADEVIFTVVSKDGSYSDIAGTIIIAGPPTNGDLTSLSSNDIANIVNNIGVTKQETESGIKYVPVITYNG